MRLRSASAWSFALSVLVACSSGSSSSSSSGGDTDSGGGNGDDAALADGAIGPSEAGSDANASDGDVNDASLSDTTPDSFVGPDASDAGSDVVDVYVPPKPPAIQYIGRVDLNDVAGARLAWPGTKIVARFDGTAVDATLKDSAGFANDVGYVDITIDGVLQTPPLQLTRGTNTYSIASGLAAGIHEVEIYKRTEPNVNVVQLINLTFPGGGQLLAPPTPKTRHIEFLSESTFDGFGVDGVGPSCPGGAPSYTHNAHRSMPQLLADAVNADLSLLGYSGKGITKNASAQDNQTFDLLFPRALPETIGNLWDFNRVTPDAVLSVLGGEDYSPPAPANFNTFKTKYDTLVGQIRTQYPNAKIFLLVGPQIRDVYPAGYASRTNIKNAIEGIQQARAANGDNNIYTYLFTENFDDNKISGCYYHPNAAYHQELAQAFEPFFKGVMGW
ncbi:MAG: GDSL-type esterase/lipase family protein [Polyangiaceae bacterium]